MTEKAVELDETSLMLKFESPFNEIQLLCQHTDIVRHLARIDSKRCCSAGDDGLVVIWDTETGSLLHILRGHSRPITCVCPISQFTNGSTELFLVTASSDRLVCIWNIETGSLLKKFTDQNSTAKCIVPLALDVGLFCSGGEKLCLWSFDDGLLDMIPTDTPDDIQFLLLMKGDVLVAAADNQIVFYRFSSEEEKRLSFCKQLERHRESIRSVARIDDSCFVSGSLDGAVLQWSLDSLTATHEYNIYDDYQGLSRTYPFSIQHLLTLDERYLFCAQGCGLIVFDMKSCRQILVHNDIHDGKVLHLELICKGYLLVTCSEDSCIKLWRCTLSSETATNGFFKGHLCKFSTCFDFYMETNQDNRKLSLQLVGECQAHSAAVQMCLDVPPDRFLSCGVDHVVILWKNSIVESCRRHKMVRDALLGLALPEDLSAED